jgi:hypothetical protein
VVRPRDSRRKQVLRYDSLRGKIRCSRIARTSAGCCEASAREEFIPGHLVSGLGVSPRVPKVNRGHVRGTIRSLGAKFQFFRNLARTFSLLNNGDSASSKTLVPPHTMTSSLAQQLQKIAAASTSTLDTKKLKTLHSVSLLFDRTHAASQGLDTIFSIALDGFNELCALDPRFAVFEKGLFSEASKDVDRFVLPKEEVAELDRSLEAFLGLVSGRLLLKPAVKAVEWLVRRFRYVAKGEGGLRESADCC